MREEDKKRTSQDSSLKRFFRQRWVFPAIYIASAAIILTGVLWYQSVGKNSNSDQFDYKSTDMAGRKQHDQPAVEVNRSLENFVMPVMDPDSAVIQKKFYDYNGKKEDQEAALVFYDNEYHPNTGIDIKMKKGDTFDVVASLSGTVTKVEEDALLGNVIEIEHDKGIVTQYQSVKDINVEVGDKVEQGQVLAKAGQSLYNKEAGVHVHFEIRKDNVAVNPLDYFNKPLSALQEAKAPGNSQVTDDNPADDQGTTEDNGAKGDTSNNNGSDKTDSGQKEDGSAQDKTSGDQSGDQGQGGDQSGDHGHGEDQSPESDSGSSDASLNGVNS
ncbi:M23 family metallopeptidase [Bacillus methanolicus]|uniref:Stage II sporulation protein Q n=1 Tax=Bacillus methanolicus (strain MGA3 / ATCC 53907) TaxID=796606 RepID=I3EBH6_BACMM|nr:M23 family metallopeptidase [Bacillus methanolicus]AIE61527.1 Stage II sporulation protein Q [Bacillus methanolicus MGA3]EIJ83847.1 Peptidase M23 [Bacillus methanolicus MGA3]